MRLITTIIIILLLFAISCNQQIQNNNQDLEDNTKKETPKQELPKTSEEKPKEIEASKQASSDQSVVGVWRPHEQAIIYDSGATNAIKPVTRRLTINKDGTWEYGSTGTWEVRNIEDKDWDKWNMHSGKETKKIVLNGWNNDIGDGPIEFGSEGVDFIWVIYRSEKLSLGHATIQIKFGH